MQKKLLAVAVIAIIANVIIVSGCGGEKTELKTDGISAAVDNVKIVDNNEKEVRQILSDVLEIYLHNDHKRIDNINYALDYIHVWVSVANKNGLKKEIVENMKRALEPKNFFYTRMTEEQRKNIVKQELEIQGELKYSIDNINVDGDMINVSVRIQKINGKKLNKSIKDTMLSMIKENKTYTNKRKLKDNQVGDTSSVYEKVNEISMYSDVTENNSLLNREFYASDGKQVTKDILSIAYKAYMLCLKKAPIEEVELNLQLRKVNSEKDMDRVIMPEYTKADGTGIVHYDMPEYRKNNGKTEINRDNSAFAKLYYFIWDRYTYDTQSY